MLDYNGLDITDRIIGTRNEDNPQFSMKSPRQTFDIDNPNDYHTYGFLWTDTEMVLARGRQRGYNTARQIIISY